eukprot:364591-Chlamydomonas_euryale.AAC.14
MSAVNHPLARPAVNHFLARPAVNHPLARPAVNHPLAWPAKPVRLSTPTQLALPVHAPAAAAWVGSSGRPPGQLSCQFRQLLGRNGGFYAQPITHTSGLTPTLHGPACSWKHQLAPQKHQLAPQKHQLAPRSA